MYSLKSILGMVLSVGVAVLCVSCEDTTSHSVPTNTETFKSSQTSTTSFDYTSLLELYPEDSLSQDLQSIEWAESMVFTDLDSMQDYIDTSVSDCQEDVGLIVPYGYTIPQTDGYDYFCKGVWSVSGSQNLLGNGEHKAYYIVYHFQYTTGRLVYNAYTTQDTSRLTPEQLLVYTIAVDYLHNTLDTSKDVVSQEKQIFDYICESTAYYTDGEDSNQYDRYKSAIGVLVDGYANCMGYADTFYMLCSMANMDVTYVSEKSMSHAWNIITLDGKRYLVDTTFADTIYGSKDYTSYEFFNASLEFVSQKYTLSDGNPTLSIQPNFDDNYYFYHPDFNPHTTTATNLYNYIVSCIQEGETLFEVMCVDTLPTNQADFTNTLLEMLPPEYSNSSIECILQPLDGYGYVLVSVT